ncbi:MAG: flavin reductase family protein [Pseudomonadota bacterium]
MPDGGNPSAMRAFQPSKATERDLRDALGRFATGICVVTTHTDKGPLGITANSFASVSLDPPLVLWSPARASKRFSAFAATREFAIHVLGEDQDDVCRRFSQGGWDFDGLDWQPGSDGTPLIEGCLARFECGLAAQHDGGDHLIIIGKVGAVAYRDGAPLLFSGGGYGRFTGAL